MNHFVHRMLGHYLMDAVEEGEDLGGSAEVEVEEGSDAVTVERDADEEPEDEDDGEVIVTLGDEPVNEPEAEDKAAPQWVKDLRKQRREDQKRIRELEQQVAAKAPEAKKALELGKKPELDDDDIDYDSVKYDARMAEYYDRKRQIEQQAAEQQRQEQEQQQAWQTKLDGYGAQKAKLKLPDYDDAEQTIQESMDLNQQAIIISGADNPALIVYALGKNPDKAKELAAIKDPVKFAFAIAKLETTVKMQKKDKPAPERVVNGNGPKSGAVEGNLDKLREEAARTGDYTKVTAFKKAQRERERAKA